MTPFVELVADSSIAFLFVYLLKTRSGGLPLKTLECLGVGGCALFNIVRFIDVLEAPQRRRLTKKKYIYIYIYILSLSLYIYIYIAIYIYLY